MSLNFKEKKYQQQKSEESCLLMSKFSFYPKIIKIILKNMQLSPPPQHNSWLCSNILTKKNSDDGTFGEEYSLSGTLDLYIQY